MGLCRGTNPHRQLGGWQTFAGQLGGVCVQESVCEGVVCCACSFGAFQQGWTDFWSVGFRGRRRGGQRGQEGQVWVAGHLSRWYQQIHVCLAVFSCEWMKGGCLGSVWTKCGCMLGWEGCCWKLKRHKGPPELIADSAHSNGWKLQTYSVTPS